MKNFILIMISILLVLLVGCGEKITKVTEVVIHDNNEDRVYTVPYGSVLGPTSASYYEEYNEETTRNHSGTGMGIDLRPDGGTIPYVAISFIAQGETKVETNVYIPLDVFFEATSVFYNPDLGSLIIQAIQLMGLDFFDQLEDWMVDSTYECLIRFSDYGVRSECIVVGPKFSEKWKQNSKNNTFRKWIFSNKSILEENLINVSQLLIELEDVKMKNNR